MDAEQLVSIWRQSKRRAGSKRLDEPCIEEHEYKGKQFGHPSTYALVRFECLPAATLSFEMNAAWPLHLEPEYSRRLEEAMATAIVDVLLASSEYPHQGCLVKCVEVGWDDVASSEIAFYRATRAAMTRLCDEGKWSFIGLQKRS